MSKLKKAVVELTGKRQTRSVNLGTMEIRAEGGDSVFELSISSETPYLRGFGYEVLPHNPEAMDISRVASGMQVLYNHNADAYIGIVEKMWFAEGTARASIRFSKNSELAKQVEADVVDKILRSVSIGYSVTEWDNPAKRTKIDDIPVYTAAKWELFEVSVVTIPADASVGFGRQMGSPSCPECDSEMDGKADGSLVCPNCGTTVIPGQDTEPTTVSEALVEVADDIAELVEVVAAAGDVALPDETGTENSVAQDSPSEAVEVMGCKPQKATEVEEEKNAALSLAENVTPHITIRENKMDNLENVANANIRLTEREEKKYSLAGAILKLADGKRDGFEFEVSNQIAKDIGREANGFWMPTSIRSFAIGDSSTGGALTFSQPGEFIDYLRIRSVLGKAGATIMSLPGKVAMPRLGSDLAATWITEDGSGTTIASASLDQVTLSPKKMVIYTGYSKETLMAANYNIENVVRNNMYASFATAFDKAGFAGTGTEQPTGLLATTGLVSSSISTSGSALTYAGAVAAWSAVATNNGDVGNLAFITDPALYGSATGIARFTYSSTGIISDAGTILNYPVYASNHVTIVATNQHYLIFGNWADLMMAEFGAIDIITDPYTSKHKGLIEVGGQMLADIQIKHIKSFAVTRGITA